MTTNPTTPPEPQAGATPDEHPATYGFKGPRPGAANLVREYPLPFEVKGDNPPMVVAANGEAILSLMWPVHVQTPEGERAAVDYVAAIAKDVADSLNRKDIPALIATPDLAAIQARCDAATPGPWVSKPIRYHDGDKFIDNCNWREIEGVETWDGSSQQRYSPKPYYIAPPDAAFIAHARTDLPALLAALATSRAETEAAKRGVNTWHTRAEAYRTGIDAANKEADALRAQLATLTATLVQREAEAVEFRTERDQANKTVIECDYRSQVLSDIQMLTSQRDNATAARDTALARVRELEGVVAAADQMRQEWRKRALKVELDAAAARADGTGEEGQ